MPRLSTAVHPNRPTSSPPIPTSASSAPPPGNASTNPRPSAASTPASPHLPLVISSFTRPARPPPNLNPNRLTIYTEAGVPQVLGRGTFGVVYPGMLDAACHIAVKHLCPRALISSSTPVSRESARDATSRHARLAKLQFRREIRRYAVLRTVPGVVRFFGLVGKDMFVIERLFGGPLSSVMRNPQDDSNKSNVNGNIRLLDTRCLLRLGCMLANAVADLHRRGLSHGDLKPSNVMLSEALSRFGGVVTDDVHVKLVDFGLSRRFQPLDGDDDDYYDDEDDESDNDFFERVSVANSSASTKIPQSVQLAARRYSCPISRPLQADNSDTDISDDDGEFGGRMRTAAAVAKHAATRSAADGDGDDDDDDDDNDDDDDDDDSSTAPHQLAAFPKDARGTPAYLSPEGWCGPSALRRRHVALKGDVYAIAMILYEMETGLVPWQGMSEWSIFVAVSNNEQRPSWPEGGPRVSAVGEIIEHCWAQNYRDRPTCRQLARRLQALLQLMSNRRHESSSESLEHEAVMHKHANKEANYGATVHNQNHNAATSTHPGFINKVSYMTPPASCQSLPSAVPTSESSPSSSAFVPDHKPQFSPTSCPAHPAHPATYHPIEDTTPTPTTTDETTTATTATSATTDTADTAATIPTATGAVPKATDAIPISITPPSSPARTSSHPSPPPIHPHHEHLSSNSYDAHTNHLPQHSLMSHADVPPKLVHSAASPPSPNMKTKSTAGHKFLDVVSATNPPPSGVVPSARQQRKEAMKPPQTIRRPSKNNIASNTRHNGGDSNVNNSNININSIDNNRSLSTSMDVPKRSTSYPHKEVLERDDCATLCALVAQHQQNEKEVTAVLEALGAALENSTHNCELFATGNTLTHLGAILSRYGPSDSRLCKSACVIITRLAVTKSALVEKRLRLASACDMTLNCIRWHAADLPVIQNGASAMHELCKLSPALRSIFVAQGGPTAALRALSRAVKSFNCDSLVAMPALGALGVTAYDHGHALLENDILVGIFRHCGFLKYESIDRGFIIVIHRLLRGLSNAKDEIVCIPDCFIVFSNLVDRYHVNSGGGGGEPDRSDWVKWFQYTCEIVSSLSLSGLRAETTTGVLKSHIVEAIVESLNKLCDRDGNGRAQGNGGGGMSNSSGVLDGGGGGGGSGEESMEAMCDNGEGVTEVSAGAKGLFCLLQLSGLGADVLGSFQMCNVSDMTRRFVKRAPNNHAIANNVALLLNSLLQQGKNGAVITNKDLVYDMLVEMKEKWRHDTVVVERVSTAMELIHPIGSLPDKVKKTKADTSREARSLVDPSTKHAVKEKGGLFRIWKGRA